MSRKVMIDTDPGIDDAVALTLALFDPRLDVTAVTAVAGNVPAPLATRNVQGIVEFLDPPRWPRIGAASPPDDGLPTDARHIHGEDGLGNAELQVAELGNLRDSEKLLADELRAQPEEYTLLALGPLTNAARLLRRDPLLFGRLGHLVMMGGAVQVPGNVTPVAEFNVYCDPPAARQVLRARVTSTLVPLDVTGQVVFSYDFLGELPAESSRVGKFLRTILPFAYRAHRQRLGLEGIHLHDAVALLAITQPELFVTETLPADVELHGELTRGQTVFDRRRQPDERPNVEVAREIDAAAAKDAILRGLHAAAALT